MISEERANIEERPTEPQSNQEGPLEEGARPREGAAPPERGRKRNFYSRRRRPCIFCLERTKGIDYKNADFLRRYLTDRGRIDTKRKAGTCAKHQRALAVAIKRARHVALLPFTADHIRKTGFFPPRHY